MASLLLPAGPREKLTFNAQWSFLQQDVAGAEAPGFDDSGWQSVALPHTFNETDTFDDWSPSDHRGEMNQWGGVVWYRKHFEVPEAWDDRRVHIEFEAVRQIAEVWINGVYLGRCDNGFVPFGFDLGPHLRPEENNVLAVRVDNSFATDSTGDAPITHPNEGNAQYPWNNPHWHPAHGGIYRNVYLHVAGPVHITLPFYDQLGTTGLYVHSRNISDEAATVTVEAEVVNRSGAPATVEAHTRLRDAEGAVVGEWTQSVSLDSGTLHTFKGGATVDQPRLWEPGHPYLYTAEVVLSVDGEAVDGAATRFGIRSVVFNRFTGFFINDRAVKLEGWGQKSTNEWAGLGAAQPDWMQYYTLQQMRGAGANFIRWGHTAGSPAQVAAAGQLGLVTLQPGVDGEKDATGNDWAVRAAAFRDTIVYYRNAPSILIWEGGNQSVSLDHVRELRGYADTFDPHGGRAYAHRRANSVVEPFLDISIGTEGGGFLSGLPVVEGEYNREEAPRRVWDRKTPPYANYKAEGVYNLTAEEYAINQAVQVEKIGPDFHSGGANWIYSDSTSGGRVTSEVTRTSGEVDAVRLPKEAYHVSQVLFRKEAPGIHLVGHWNYPPGTSKTVWVAANGHEVELLRNGQSLGRRTADSKSPFLFRFDDVAYQQGKLEAVLFDVDGTESNRTFKETAGPATALRITPITGPEGFYADGSDVALFDVEAVDAEGRRNPVWNGRVDFATTGPAIWRGGYNSGRINSTNHPWLDLESGINRVAVRSNGSTGTVTVSVEAEGLASAAVSIEALPDGGAILSGAATRTLPPMPAQAPLTPLPAPPPQDRLDAQVGSGETPEPTTTRFFRNLAYSGPGGEVAVRTDPDVGTTAYTDTDLPFNLLPPALAQGEQIAFPLADRAFSAVDLLQVEIVEATPLFLLHDAALDPPGWLQNNFHQTAYTIVIGERTHRAYRRDLAAGETVLLGSNQEGEIIPEAQMYVLIAPGEDSIVAEGGDVAENAQRLRVEVSRGGLLPGNDGVEVNYQTRDGSALAGRDYQSSSGKLIWQNGEIGPRTFDVEILNNATFTGDRSFEIGLSSPAPGRGLPKTLPFRILEDEVPSRAQRILAAAEAVLGGGSTLEQEHAGFNGGGFINFPTSNGTLTWSDIEGGLGGTATLALRYALSDTQRTLEWSLNSGESRQITFAGTDGWDRWETQSIDIELPAGTGNTLTLRSIGEDGPNLDRAQLSINETLGKLPAIDSEPLDRIVDAGKSLELFFAATPVGATEFRWFRDGHALGTTATPQWLLTRTEPREQGNYWVEIRNASGSVNTRTFRVEVRITQVYAFGSSAAATPLLRQSASGTRTLRFHGHRENLIYQLESSPNLREGSWQTLPDEEAIPLGEGLWEFNLPTHATGREFYRVRASPAPAE